LEVEEPVLLVMVVVVVLTVVAVRVETVVSDDDCVVLETELVEVLLTVLVNTPMQINCMVAEPEASVPVDFEK
jgi:hypothetical protein